jgi:hypothetical protein
MERCLAGRPGSRGGCPEGVKLSHAHAPEAWPLHPQLRKYLDGADAAVECQFRTRSLSIWATLHHPIIPAAPEKVASPTIRTYGAYGVADRFTTTWRLV